MPRYYTLVINDDSIENDDEGQDFDTEDAALANASRTATALLDQHLGSGSPAAAFKLFVQNTERQHVATISVMGMVVR